jgi:2-oxoisovalerate dehydrogenase E1 component
MPKGQVIKPEEVRKPGVLKFNDIVLNQYQKTIKDEKENFTKDEFLRIYRDMLYIRQFEDMLFELRANKQWKGVEYQYSGPAHLYTGQEAAAVGQAFILDKDDFTFGSHRSHGEIIAKGLSCIVKLEDDELMTIMNDVFEGSIIGPVKAQQKNTEDVRALAVDFLFYGIMAELFGRKTGFAQGLGNSMHAFFTPFGVYPNNAIVGGSAPIAMGAALYKKINKKKGICISNSGDGSLGCGPVWEAMNMAAMDQMNELWDDAYKGGLPIIFNFFNNQYGMGGQTKGETMAYGILARVGAGINPDQMHAERVDGYNPLAVIDVMKRKKKILEENRGPVLLDIVTYRTGGHSASDPGPYRSKEEVEAWLEVDSIKVFKEELVREEVATTDEILAIEKEVEYVLIKNLKLAIDEEISPRMDFLKEPDAIEKFMFSNQSIEKMDDRACEVLMPLEENPRVRKIAKKERVGIIDGKEVSKLKTLSLRDGLFESIINKFYTDPTLIAYGEDNRDWGGAFAVYQGLTEAIPYHRMFNSPISEAAIVGSAVGYAMCGGRIIVELMYCDFMGRAGDEIFNQLAKWQSMSAGVLKMPVVLRVSVGSKYGAQHSQDWTALTAHVPGLKVVYPVTPYDAKGLMNSALNGTDPVVFFESQKLYDIGEMFQLDGVPETNYEIVIGEPDIKREGSDITILTIGATLYKAIEAAEILEKEYGISAEVIDARSVVPFNYEKVLASVKKTGRILLSSDACERGSALEDMARNITEMAFDDLDAPPVVVGAKNWITPCYELENEFFPQADWLIDAIHQKIMPIKGYTPKQNFTKLEQLRKEKLGV